MKTTLCVMVLLSALPALAAAQKPVTETAAVELTATIEAIDHDARLITLKDKDGVAETVYAGPEMKRFDELKVGDTVTFRYYESVAFEVRKPGQPSTSTRSGGEKLTRGTGPRPGGTVSRQETATVVVEEIDRNAPSITVLTKDGRRASFKVENKKHLEGVQPGDRVDITYTVALLISVK